MKILFVITNLANGGAERVLEVISKQFAKKNEVHIAVLEKDYQIYEFLPEIKLHHLNQVGGNIFARCKKILALRSCIKAVKPDVLISFIDWCNVLSYIANLGLKTRQIATEHHANLYLKSQKFRAIRDFVYTRIGHLSVLSKSDYNYYKNFVKNVTILHNPCFLPYENLQDIKKENVILSVGRLEAVKGYDIYFKALAKIDKNLLKDYEILIAGEGKEEQNLKDLALSLDLNVNFLGHIKDLASLYKKAKIFVLSSRSEGLSNVLIESANYACARISSNTVGGYELITNGINGLLFESENYDELATTLSALMKDEMLCKNIGENAKNSADEFSVEKIFAKWEKFVKQAIKGQDI
ncbi:MAG: glycosyltransferase [Campylobacter sp.]|nr:glycosyltransferase [Campylobacter sp.]